MSDTILAYLISLGILGAGAIWIVSAAYLTPAALYVAVGVPTTVVGLVSFFAELRN
jgi:hypothetical protein